MHSSDLYSAFKKKRIENINIKQNTLRRFLLQEWKQCYLPFSLQITWVIIIICKKKIAV